MNDHELHYMYYARSRELIAQAERAREAERAHKAAKAAKAEKAEKAEREGGPAGRLAKSLGRKERRSSKGAGLLQTAK